MKNGYNNTHLENMLIIAKVKSYNKNKNKIAQIKDLLQYIRIINRLLIDSYAK